MTGILAGGTGRVGDGLRDTFLVAGGAGLLILQFYRPIVPLMVFGFFVLGLVPFVLALRVSRWPFLLGMIPSVILIFVFYVREILLGRMLLIPENVANLAVAVTMILFISTTAAFVGTFLRPSR